MSIFLFLMIIFNFALLTFNLRSAAAQTMSNDNYILQLNDIKTVNPKPTVTNNILGVTSEHPVIELSEPFTFSISQTLIDFSTLSPTNPIKRSNKLIVSEAPATGYSIIAFEDKELSAASDVATSSSSPQSGISLISTFIPDTSCDNGQCSETRSDLWTNPLTYGFGYRCDNKVGNDCANGFSESTFYKQFANTSLSEIPQKVAGSLDAVKNNIVQITYKVNIANTQHFAFYSNTITYIAVPNF